MQARVNTAPSNGSKDLQTRLRLPSPFGSVVQLNPTCELLQPTVLERIKGLRVNYRSSAHNVLDTQNAPFSLYLELFPVSTVAFSSANGARKMSQNNLSEGTRRKLLRKEAEKPHSHPVTELYNSTLLCCIQSSVYANSLSELWTVDHHCGSIFFRLTKL